jgi:hypothetical protein
MARNESILKLKKGGILSQDLVSKSVPQWPDVSHKFSSHLGLRSLLMSVRCFRDDIFRSRRNQHNQENLFSARE